jgi:hypothetical protein
MTSVSWCEAGSEVLENDYPGRTRTYRDLLYLREVLSVDDPVDRRGYLGADAMDFQ